VPLYEVRVVATSKDAATTKGSSTRKERTRNEFLLHDVVLVRSR
jgi:hypothetical protein